MLLGIIEGPDGKKFKFLTPSGATGIETSTIFVDLSGELCQNANKGIFNLRHLSNLLIVDRVLLSVSQAPQIVYSCCSGVC